MTLEEKIDSASDDLSAMSNRASQPDEWQLINDMHLTICELKGQLVQLRQTEKRNIGMKP